MYRVIIRQLLERYVEVTEKTEDLLHQSKQLKAEIEMRKKALAKRNRG